MIKVLRKVKKVGFFLRFLIYVKSLVQILEMLTDVAAFDNATVCGSQGRIDYFGIGFGWVHSLYLTEGIT